MATVRCAATSRGFLEEPREPVRLGAPAGQGRGGSQRPRVAPDERLERRRLEPAHAPPRADPHDGYLSRGDEGLDRPLGHVEARGGSSEVEERRLPYRRTVASGGDLLSDGTAEKGLQVGGEGVRVAGGRHGNIGAARPARTRNGLPFGAAEVGSPFAFAPGGPGGRKIGRGRRGGTSSAVLGGTSTFGTAAASIGTLCRVPYLCRLPDAVIVTRPADFVSVVEERGSEQPCSL